MDEVSGVDTDKRLVIRATRRSPLRSGTARASEICRQGAASSRELGREDLHEHASDQRGCRRSRGGRPARSVEHGALGSRSAGLTSGSLVRRGDG